MRERFENQLMQLNTELITMGALCEEAIACAVKYLLEGNVKMKESAADIEKRTDRKERDIETLCMRLLLMQQPVAADLRTVSSALKMISDMERIGDQAYDISEIAEYIVNKPIRGRVHISDMAETAAQMVTLSVESFVKKDLQLARSVIKLDDKVDGLFLTVKNELIEAVRSNNENGETLVDLMMTAKYFERIGDHAVNIAEQVIYAVTGVHDSKSTGDEPSEQLIFDE